MKTRKEVESLKANMKFKLETKVNYAMSVPAMSCELNGQVCKGWGIVKGYEKANGTMMYVVANYGNINNVRLYFESELSLFVTELNKE